MVSSCLIDPRNLGLMSPKSGHRCKFAPPATVTYRSSVHHKPVWAPCRRVTDAHQSLLSSGRVRRAPSRAEPSRAAPTMHQPSSRRYFLPARRLQSSVGNAPIRAIFAHLTPQIYGIQVGRRCQKAHLPADAAAKQPLRTSRSRMESIFVQSASAARRCASFVELHSTCAACQPIQVPNEQIFRPRKRNHVYLFIGNAVTI